MSSDLAIRVQGVSKRFEVFASPRDQLKQFILPRIQRLGGLPRHDYFREFWALRNVDLDVRRGESCAIVGLNGSGKSTLLQIITGTLTPTTGSVILAGRVAALLELGSGFNPEFTGRENAFMNGTLLGFARQQITDRMGAIEEFADIGEHFDRPLKTYSSGMQMRVAFAVATAFDPEILVVDEALAVGDIYFQQKCFRRLERFRQDGGTLLFVSHDSAAVKHLCDKALLLSEGRAICQGTPREVIDVYEGLVAKMTDVGGAEVRVTQQPAEELVWQKATTVVTNGDAELVSFHLRDDQDREVATLESESRLAVEYVVRMKKAFHRPAFGLIIRDRIGRSIFETSTYAMRLPEKQIAEGQLVRVRFSFLFNVRQGTYSFSVGVANSGIGRTEFEEYSLLMHDVQQLQVTECLTAPAYGGVFNLDPKVSVEECVEATPW